MRGMRLPIRFPSYHCTLADTLLVRLGQSEAAEEIVRCMKAAREDGLQYAVYGPDQEPLSPSTCTQTRCVSRCEPGFRDLLSFFHLDMSLPDCASTHTEDGATEPQA